MRYPKRIRTPKPLYMVFSTIMVLFLLIGSLSAERVGDKLQGVLPILGAVCAYDKRDFKDYLSRYLTTLATVHIVKRGLGEAPVNIRPDGYNQGLPSGHTMSAAFGASYLIYECADTLPYIGPIAALGAGFTAASRVEAEKHNTWQIFMGAVFGMVGERLWKRKIRRKSISLFKKSYQSVVKPKKKERLRH